MEYNLCISCDALYSTEICQCPRCGSFSAQVVEIRKDEPSICVFCKGCHSNNGKFLCELCEEEHEPHSLDVIYDLLEQKESLEAQLDTEKQAKEKVERENVRLKSEIAALKAERDILVAHKQRIEEFIDNFTSVNTFKSR